MHYISMLEKSGRFQHQRSVMAFRISVSLCLRVCVTRRAHYTFIKSAPSALGLTEINKK